MCMIRLKYVLAVLAKGQISLCNGLSFVRRPFEIYEIDFYSSTDNEILMKFHLYHPGIYLSKVCTNQMDPIINYVTGSTNVKTFNRLLLKNQQWDYDETSDVASWH